MIESLAVATVLFPLVSRRERCQVEAMSATLTAGDTLAQRLAGRLARRVQTPNLPLLGQVAAWLDLVEVARELDRWLAVTEKPARADVDLHRAIVALAIGTGELLRFEFTRTPLDLTPLGINEAVLSASLQMLSDSFHLWHDDMSAERREEILQEVFGVAA